MPSSSIFTGLSGEISLRFWRFELDFFSSLSVSLSSSSSVLPLNLNGRTPDGVRGEWAGVDPLCLGMLVKPRESTLAPRKRRYSSRYS